MSFQLIRTLLLLCLIHLLVACSGSTAPANTAPEIQCQPIEQLVLVDESLALSCDIQDDGLPDASLLTSWEFLSVPDGFVPVSLEQSGSVSITPTVPGEFELKLTVDDGEKISTAELSFTALVNNAPVITCDSVPNPVARDEALTVNCLVEDDGIPSEDIELEWTLEQAPDGVGELELGTQANTTFTPRFVGEYLLKLTATDGNQSSFADIQLNVVNTNTPPEITCINSKFSTALGEPLEISCSVIDDGKPDAATTLEWRSLLAPAGAGNLAFSADPSIVFTPDTAGNYEFEIMATDGEFASSHSISVWVTPPTVRILPLGDSITQGVSGLESYRYRLWKKLLDADFDFDFVGTSTETLGDPPAYPDYLGQQFDRDHDGNSGWTADDVANPDHLPVWLATYDMDVVLLHIGTNDMFASVINTLPEQSVSSTIDEIEQIIGLLRNDNPAVTILLAVPIPSTWDTKLPELQESIRNLPASTSTVASKVILVDQAAGFDATAGVDTLEGIHPNPAGEEKMAQKWLEAILAL